ncbi:MAG: hypothetical protein ACM65M_12980 [Microcoleus sp.]
MRLNGKKNSYWLLTNGNFYDLRQGDRVRSPCLLELETEMSQIIGIFALITQ